MTAPIDRAYVEILPSLKTFNNKLKEDVQAAVTGVNKQFNGISDNAKVVADKSGSHLNKSFDGVKEHVRGIGTSLKGLLAPALALGTVAGGAAFLKDIVQQGRDAQKTMAQTAAVIKSTGGAAHVSSKDVDALSKSLSAQTGIEDDMISANQNMLLTFTGVRNEVGKGNDIFNRATETVLNMSVALKEDGKNAAIQLGKALNDPIKGITALSRVGVTFTAQQKTQIKTLVDSGHSLEAQKIILNELNHEFGGSAVAQATAGDKMKAVWANVKQELGTKLLPVVDAVSNFVSKHLVGALDKLSSGFSVAAKYAKTFVASFKSGDIEASNSTFQNFAANAGNFFAVLKGGSTAVAPEAQSAITKVAATIHDTLGKAFAFIKTEGPKIFTGLKQAITNLAQVVLPLVVAAWNAFRVPLMALIKFVISVAIPVIVSISKFLMQHKTIVQTVLIVIGTAVVIWKVWTTAIKVWAAVTKAAGIVMAAFNLIMAANPILLVVIAIAALVAGFIYAYKHSKTFRDFIQGIWEVIQRVGHAIFDFLKTWGPLILALFLPIIGIPLLIWQHWSQIVGFLQSVWSSVWSFLKTWGPLILSVFMPVIGIPLLIWQHWSQIVGFLTTVWNEVWKFLKTWGPVALLVLMPFIGIPLMIWKNFSKIKSFLGDAFSAAYNTVVRWINNTVSFVSGLPGKIANLGGAMLKAGAHLLGSLFDGIRNALKGAGQFAVDIGKDIVNGIIHGLNAILPHHLSLHFKIPVVGTKVGFDIPFIPEIPYLARGGMTTGPVMIGAGDNPSGEELIAPMDSPKTVHLLASAMTKAQTMTQRSKLTAQTFDAHSGQDLGLRELVAVLKAFASRPVRLEANGTNIATLVQDNTRVLNRRN